MKDECILNIKIDGLQEKIFLYQKKIFKKTTSISTSSRNL